VRSNAPIYKEELPKIQCVKDLVNCQVADMPPTPKLSKHIIGKASWYGGRFHGRKTASGERFNKHALTAAHKTLPLGSRVMVTNLKNNSSVIVKINDRGPFVRGRIIDLSQAAAQVIGINGVENVKISKLN
jgi:rare lipoprotein A